ncbi:hypothetical protein ASG88_15420 [Nocardioides sp. Soil777]|uniref:hypothetical protein n=1 Tax=Nocardioides sp. Soil777 TaxID=1736409 RepID=UPI000703342F|nr:hypothetical protein [Nocardioides sp. Soil777]KRE99119.1 hypothetical protein ASG88_15420 [Nocardioides sp. Soil777]
MATLRSVASSLLSWGVPSRGWYSVLTGVALVVVALGLATASGSDPAAPIVAVVLFLAGVWQLERGLRAEFQRRPQQPDEPR